MKGYKPIDVPEFIDFIENRMGFKEVFPKGYKERVWDRQLDSTPYNIRVCSTLTIGKGSHSRRAGRDAIRVVLVKGNSDRPFYTATSVYRTQNALENMRKRCRETILWYRAMKCGKCDHGMLLERTNKKDGHKFYGCSNFPECKHTEKEVGERVNKYDVSIEKARKADQKKKKAQGTLNFG